jgi:hypothetical protein
MAKKVIVELTVPQANALLTLINERATGLLTQKSGYLNGRGQVAAERGIAIFEEAWRKAIKHR